MEDGGGAGAVEDLPNVRLSSFAGKLDSPILGFFFLMDRGKIWGLQERAKKLPLSSSQGEPQRSTRRVYVPYGSG